MLLTSCSLLLFEIGPIARKRLSVRGDDPSGPMGIDRLELIVESIEGELSVDIDEARTFVDDQQALADGDIASPPSPFSGQPTHFCDIF